MDQLDKTAVCRLICATIVLSVLFLAGLAIVLPFIPSILLALIFTVATWPAFLWVKARLKNRALPAAVIMTLGLALCFIVPFLVLGNNLVGNFAQFSGGLIAFFQDHQNNPPAWLSRIPLFGAYIDKYWIDYINNTAYIAKTLKDNLELISRGLLTLGTSIGRGIADLALGIFFTFFLFFHGQAGMRGLRILLDRFVGPRAQHLLAVSRTVMVGIISGLLGTSLAQATVAGIGFWIADVPGPAFLALLIFLLSPVPIGPPLVWVPATIWLFSRHDIGGGVFMFFWGLFAISAIDNVIRPYLISQGSRMPLLLVLVGAVGGVLTFGFVGFFIGPTILAVIYALLLDEIRAGHGLNKV